MDKEIRPKDLKGDYNLTVNIKDTIPYQYYFKKFKGKVYKVSKLGNEEWRADEMPFEIPYVLLDTKNYD